MITRRKCLQATVAGLSTAGLIGLAGCGGDGDGTTAAGNPTTADDSAETTSTARDGTTTDVDEDDDVPEATFEFEYDAGAGTLTITYTGGDNVAADQLMVTGTVGAGNTGVWADLPGAEASMEVAGTRSLGLQDSVTLGAAEDQDPVPGSYVVELVFVTDGGGETVIASDRGPEA